MKKFLVTVGLGLAAVAATVVFIKHFSDPEEKSLWDDDDNEDDDEDYEDEEFFDESYMDEIDAADAAEEAKETKAPNETVEKPTV